MVKFSAVNEQVHVCHDSDQVSDILFFVQPRRKKKIDNERSAPQSLGLTECMI